MESAGEINQARETRRQLNIVLETHLKEVATQMVESLYRMVVPEGNLAVGKELKALVTAHFEKQQDRQSHETDAVDDQ